jgi:hypothetical protein
VLGRGPAYGHVSKLVFKPRSHFREALGCRLAIARPGTSPEMLHTLQAEAEELHGFRGEVAVHDSGIDRPLGDRPEQCDSLTACIVGGSGVLCVRR